MIFDKIQNGMEELTAAAVLLFELICVEPGLLGTSPLIQVIFKTTTMTLSVMGFMNVKTLRLAKLHEVTLQ
jgi:hypothetical protein